MKDSKITYEQFKRYKKLFDFVDTLINKAEKQKSKCKHEHTIKNMMTGIVYCSNPSCHKIIDIQ